MRKIFTAFLLFDLIVGLLFVGVYEREMSTRMVNAQAAANIKRIALTFDDGPHPYYTEQLLDGLKERGVVVTFFVTGEHAALHPEVIKRMQEEGHLIGNHTYSHMQLRKDNLEKFKEELESLKREGMEPERKDKLAMVLAAYFMFIPEVLLVGGLLVLAMWMFFR